MHIKRCERYGTVNMPVTTFDIKYGMRSISLTRRCTEEVLEFFNKEMRNKD